MVCRGVSWCVAVCRVSRCSACGWWRRRGAGRGSSSRGGGGIIRHEGGLQQEDRCLQGCVGFHRAPPARVSACLRVCVSACVSHSCVPACVAFVADFALSPVRRRGVWSDPEGYTELPRLSEAEVAAQNSKRRAPPVDSGVDWKKYKVCVCVCVCVSSSPLCARARGCVPVSVFVSVSVSVSIKRVAN
jgi:hypothetical protein